MFKNHNDLSSLKICDFGLATYSNEREYIKCGTLIYMAPEIDKKSYDHVIDIWSCGFILYIICSGGKHPIYANNMTTDTYVKELKLQREWTFPPSFPL